MTEKILEGIYLDEFKVKGYVLNSWKTLNMNTAYRIRLLNPQEFFGYIHEEVIIFEEDIIS